MAALRAFLAELECGTPETVLQSGNAVFSSRLTPAALETRFEVEGRHRLGIDTAVVVRSAEEWRAIVAGNPYEREARTDPSHLLLVCLKERATPAAAAALRDAIRGRETFHLGDRHAYIVYPDGIGRSKLTMTVFEKAIGTVGTARNWNTVMKIHALLT